MFKKLLIALLPLVTLVGCNKKDPPLYITNLGSDAVIKCSFNADDPEYVPNLQYSFNQKKWETLNIVNAEITDIVTLTKGQTIYFCGDNPNSFCYYSWNNNVTSNAYFSFVLANPSVDTKLKIGGNVMSLLSIDNYTNNISIPCDGCFNSLFRCFGQAEEKYTQEIKTIDIDASELLLPATELKPYSYYSMFNHSPISKAPLILPATNSAKGMYESMFEDCGNLVTAPIINLNNLSESSCSNMFNWCTSLDISKNEGNVKIFTCPDDISEYRCVNRMFRETKQKMDDPQPGEVFYYN